jgi:hypothetical protein
MKRLTKEAIKFAEDYLGVKYCGYKWCAEAHNDEDRHCDYRYIKSWYERMINRYYKKQAKIEDYQTIVANML